MQQLITIADICLRFFFSSNSQVFSTISDVDGLVENTLSVNKLLAGTQ